eukprot:3833489-Rhodomonas_salina.3
MEAALTFLEAMLPFMQAVLNRIRRRAGEYGDGADVYGVGRGKTLNFLNEKVAVSYAHPVQCVVLTLADGSIVLGTHCAMCGTGTSRR